MKRLVPTYLKVLILLLVVVLFLPVLVFFSLQIKPIEQAISRRITRILSKSLNTVVQVRDVSYSLDNRLIIKGIYVEDYNLDTLFYLDKASFWVWEIFRKQLNFNTIFISGLKVRIREDTSGYSNLLYFLENLPTNRKPKDTTASKPVAFSVRKIVVRNCDLAYYKALDSIAVDQFNPKYFRIRPLNFTIKDFTLNDSLISFVLYDFYFKDQISGFEIKDFAGRFAYSPTSFQVEQLWIKFFDSQIFLPKVRLEYPEPKAIADLSKLNFWVSLDTSTRIYLRDLRFFRPELGNSDLVLRPAFLIYGNLADLNLMPFELGLGEQSSLYLDGKLLGLPQKQNLYFDLQLDTFQLSMTDLAKILSLVPKFKLPKQLTKLRHVSLSGRVTGLLDDLSVFGHLRTNLGSILINADLQLSSGYKAQGYMIADELDLNSLSQNALLGKVSFVDSFVVGMVDTLFWGESNLFVKQIYLNGYPYSNLRLDLSFKQRHFYLDFAVNDSNLVASVDGDFSLEKLRKANLKIVLDTARLYALNLEKQDPNSTLSFGLNMNFQGHNLDDLEGQMTLTKPLRYIKNLELLEVKRLNLGAEVYPVASDTLKQMWLNSDFLDLAVNGRFRYSALASYLRNIISRYLPAVFPGSEAGYESESMAGAFFRLKMVVKDISPLTRIFAPQLELAKGAEVFASYADSVAMLKVDFHADSLLIASNKLLSPALELVTTDSSLNFDFGSAFMQMGFAKLERFRVKAAAANDTVKYIIKWHNTDTAQRNFALLKGDVFFLRRDSLFWFLTNRYDSLIINNRQWHFVIFNIGGCKKNYKINVLAQNPDFDQQINIFGKVSPTSKDSLIVAIESFDISALNPLLPKVNLAGSLYSITKVTNIFGKPIVLSDSRIKDFYLNGVNLETLIAHSDFDTKENLLTFWLKTQKQVRRISGNQQRDSLIKVIDMNGFYNLADQSYKVTVNLRKFRLRTLKPYFSLFIKGINPFSSVDGSLTIAGQGKQANLKGDIYISSTAFRLAQTNVNYTVNGQMGIHFTSNRIVIDTTTLISQGGTGKGKFWGTIYKNQYGDFVYDLHFVPQKLMVLNLKPELTRSYYGQGFVSGNINFQGFANNFFVNADIRTEPGTDLTFKINAPKTISAQSNFIHFVGQDTTETAQNKTKTKNKTSSLDLNVNLEVTPQSKFNIVIDEQTGEQLNLQGRGLLNIKMTPYGGLLLFGTLTIEEGFYNFSLENLITKKFEIQSGSTIKWNGSPKDAKLDLIARYTLKSVSLYDLTLDDNYWGERTVVNCLIKIQGTLTKPLVSFDLELPKADQRIVSQVKNLDPAEKTKQVLSLLVLGKFQPLPGLAFDPTKLAGSMSAKDVISSQLSNLLSNLDENLQLGVNYQGQDQLELALSYKLWNERIIINTDVGFGSDQKNASAQNTNQFIGDVEIEVKLNKKGNLRLKAFNKTNRNEFYDKGPYTYGIGIFFQKDFSTLLPWLKQKDTAANARPDSLNRKK